MSTGMRKGISLLFVALMVAVIGQAGFSWTVGDPEIEDLGGVISVRDYEGEIKFDLNFLYLNDRSINYIWSPALAAQVKQVMDDRNCLFVVVFVKQSAYFWPTSIIFVQGRSQYEINYDDIVKISDTFSGDLRPGIVASGLVFVPEGIDIHLPMRLYYDDDYVIFSIPEEEAQESIEQQIRQLEAEKARLEIEISERQDRITEINQKLEELRTQRTSK